MKINGAYSEDNPRIRLYDSSGRYLFTTQWYATIKAALENFKDKGANTGEIIHA